MADGGGLENRYGVTPIVGSNPTPSALACGLVPSERLRTLADGHVGAACPLRAPMARGPARREPPKALRNLGVAAPSRVLIGQRHPRRRVTGTPYDLGEGPRRIRTGHDRAVPRPPGRRRSPARGGAVYPAQQHHGRFVVDDAATGIADDRGGSVRSMPTSIGLPPDLGRRHQSLAARCPVHACPRGEQRP